MSDSRPPFGTTTSILPAASILGIAIGVLAIFLTLNIIASPRVSSTSTIPIVVGGLPVASGTSTFATTCNANQLVPDDVVRDLLLPVRTTQVHAPRVLNAGAGDFDCTADYRTTATSGEILGFFDDQLRVRGWHHFSTGSSKGEPQFLFQKSGSDGFYWIIGVTVTRSTSTTSTWTYRVYQSSETV